MPTFRNNQSSVTDERESFPMKKHGAPLTYLAPNGTAVVSQPFTLTDREVEVVEVRDLIVAEGDHSPVQAGLLTLPVMPDADPSFVEWITCGVVRYSSFGTFGRFDIDPDVASWAETVALTGKVW